MQERGHVFLLTDLMLVGEKMTPKEMEAAGRDGPDMWLLYPPLAGKHLRVAPVDGTPQRLCKRVLSETHAAPTRCLPFISNSSQGDAYHAYGLNGFSRSSLSGLQGMYRDCGYA